MSSWRCNCCREKSLLTPCWNCFFDFLSVAFVIIITHNGLPQRILPFCLTAKLTSLCLEPCPPVNSRKTGINTSPCLRLAIPGDICKIKGLFTLFPHLPHLWSVKELGIQTPSDARSPLLLFWELVCHLFGLKSYSLPQCLLWTCRGESRVSLESVT